ncbi:hypothetical protein SLW70_11605 [Flavobacterium sp. NG2]|uniref:hypothetical protein n=1 Tax=Flavobacterium sp. NG2 TaxID=3097547 RepID=UPI002A836555|nr:hypothetical protein [Flavobacterium sp. NG2]WPR70577.1 hypothetical protein SLW70_11605 [Flavobacterium sp. NG2]
MTEIFITDIETKIQAKHVLDYFKTNNPDLKINYDLNETEKSYPCGHTVLRVEGYKIERQSILTALQKLGHKSEILEDKICV